MQLIVGVGDMKVASDPSAVLATYSLGSCIGVAIYDPEVRVGDCYTICCRNPK